MGLFGLEAFSLSFLPSLISSIWILIFGAFDIPAENKSRAVESLIQGTLSAIRATNSKVTFDPIRRDVTNDKVVFPNIEIIIPGNKNVYNYNQNCIGNYSENFKDKCSTKVSIESLSVNNIGLKENRKQNVELEISGFSVDLKHLLSNDDYISAQMLDPINELIENGVLAGSVKVGVGYNLGLDQFSLELSIALNKLASFSIKTKLSNVKYHNNTYSFDLDELEVAVSEDGLRPFLDYQLQNTIGLELNSGMLLMLTAGIDEEKKGSLKDLKNIRSIASFIDGKSKKLFCKRGESIHLDFSNLDATGYLESPFSIVGVLCQEFTNSAY